YIKKSRLTYTYLLFRFIFVYKFIIKMNIEKIDLLRIKLQESLDLLVNRIGPIQIGQKAQFPYGWRKAAKGRTVWRIVEEIIIQNLEKYYTEFNLKEIKSSEGEVTVHDMECKFSDDELLYVNIKSAVCGGRKNKDDISKAAGLKNFYDADANRNFFIATFFIKFNESMSIEIEKAVVFPIVWIKDIYVNPSNNGNLQSAYYKDLDDAVKRTNHDFLKLFHDAMDIAAKKKEKKYND
ncbi:MAG: hypothetical protein RR837_10540, partial [Bacteroidales bacterium]